MSGSRRAGLADHGSSVRGGPSRWRRLAGRLETSWGIGLLAFAEALFLPIPIEAALAPMMIYRPHRRWAFALYALIGSLAGLALLYGTGLLFFDVVGTRIIQLNGWQDHYAAFQDRMDRQGVLTIAVVAITPIPFTLAALGAGAAKMNVLLFLVVAGAVRAARYGLVAVLVGLFGDQVRIWLERLRTDKQVQRLSLALMAIAIGLLAWWWIR